MDHFLMDDFFFTDMESSISLEVSCLNEKSSTGVVDCVYIGRDWEGLPGLTHLTKADADLGVQLRLPQFVVSFICQPCLGNYVRFPHPWLCGQREGFQLTKEG